MNKLKKQIHKEFDEKFNGKIILEKAGTQLQGFYNNPIKSFIDQSIDLAQKEERERIVDWLEKRCEDNYMSHGTDKWNSDMEDLIEILKNETTTPNN